MAKQPGLFLEHAGAYVDLAAAEASAWSGQVKARVGMALAAALLTVLGLGLAGVSGLLVAALPTDAMPYVWLLWAIPLLPLSVGAWLVWMVQHSDAKPIFAALRQQVSQDVATLKILDDE